MREFKKCELCKEWHWTNMECNPVYFVYHEEYMGDEPKSVRANDHEDAALKYGQYYNESGDYSLMNGDTIKVKVEKDDVIRFFEISAEQDINYSSKEIDSLDT